LLFLNLSADASGSGLEFGGGDTLIAEVGEDTRVLHAVVAQRSAGGLEGLNVGLEAFPVLSNSLGNVTHDVVSLVGEDGGELEHVSVDLGTTGKSLNELDGVAKSEVDEVSVTVGNNSGEKVGGDGVGGGLGISNEKIDGFTVKVELTILHDVRSLGITSVLGDTVLDESVLTLESLKTADRVGVLHPCNRVKITKASVHFFGRSWSHSRAIASPR